ncbi:toprim domain-containing protein [Alysiella crassa]|uniref:Uncharacterized protein conserved in bacteria n=1 Tax=Alysiella crassa TaxID=153491 RepID=A0A376BKR0_9NEIS|nr:toprim domain-containing protein [Alysiella crassa]UOP07563.1 toprim domain-containing protein [Alysiella crassa]SSY70223.1 Uncharacterized protein conserved in bacteria [Alysiella crassa]
MFKHSLNDIKTAACGNWQAIHATLGIPPHLTNTRKHQPCPHCGGKDRYRYTDFQGNGGFICSQCTPSGGSGFDLLMLVLGLNFNESVKEVAAVLGMNNHTPKTHQPRQTTTPAPKQPEIDRLPELQQRFQAAHALAPNGAVMAYLAGRGLPEWALPAAAIRETVADYWAQDVRTNQPLHMGRFACMVAAITLPNGKLQGLHYTYLQNNGNHWAKLNITHPQTNEPLPAKKMFARFSGSLKGAAVHMERADDKGRLLIAEGLETTLAARALFGLPAVAALSANGMRSFSIPDDVQEIYICADNDYNKAGFRAAHDLAVRAIELGLTAHIWQPEIMGTDGLDEYRRRHSI